MNAARVVEIVNRKNRVSTCLADIRKGWNLLLEEILLETDTYGGFVFLSESEVPDGQPPGYAIYHNRQVWPDDTRRRYYQR